MSRADPKAAKTHELVAELIKRRDPRVSDRKAMAKGQSVVQGVIYIVMGLVAFLVALALPVVAFLVFRKDLSTPMLIAVFLAAGAAFLTAIWLVVGGGNVMSGEGIDAAADDMTGLFGLFAKAVKLLRKKGNGS